MNLKKRKWGEYQGETVWLYSMNNEAIEVSMSNYGCTIVSILVNGKLIDEKKPNESQRSELQKNENHAVAKNVIAGYSTFDELLADKYYMGSIVGRFAGRISNASFEIDGVQYRLPANDGKSGNHLHGGPQGFSRMLFTVIAEQCSDEEASITFHGISCNMDQGYPGELDITFTISLNAENEISFYYLAKPDLPTHINLTHHLYYNLGCNPATDQIVGSPGTELEFAL